MNGGASRYKTDRAARRRKRIVYRGEALQRIETELEGAGTVASSRPPFTLLSRRALATL